MTDTLTEHTPALQRRLAAAADRFASADFLHARTADELVARLDLLRITPRTVVDAGAAAGTLAQRLAQRYPDARTIAVEQSAPLAGAVPQSGRLARWLGRRPRIDRLAAPLSALPFDDDRVDLVASNLALPRYAAPDAALAEIARVLAPGGAFAFVTLGPDTLRELRDAWRDVDDADHVAVFPDMHDVGDALGRAGFTEPVLDVEPVTLSYETPAGLWRDLTSLGARNCLPGRHRGLTGRGRFEAMLRHLGAGPVTISVELIYGQCWGTPAARQRGEVSIRPDAIGRR